MSAYEDRIFQSEADFWKEQMKLKPYRDIKNSLDTKWEEGREEGQVKERKRIAKDMISDGCPIETVIKYPHLTREEIEKLKDEH